MTSLTFRQRTALTLLDKWADKIFDERFIREANDAGVEVSDLLTAYIEETTDSFMRTF
jgi:predicted outer membrane protein